MMAAFSLSWVFGVGAQAKGGEGIDFPLGMMSSLI